LRYSVFAEIIIYNCQAEEDAADGIDYNAPVRARIEKVLEAIIAKRTAQADGLKNDLLSEIDADGSGVADLPITGAFDVIPGVPGLAIAPALSDGLIGSLPYPGGALALMANSDGNGGLLDEDEEKERLVQEEIGKFRVRQAARDK